MSEQPRDYYLRQFRSLSNRDRAHDYGGLSIEGAPHQPLLLLAVLDLYAHDSGRHNLIEIDDLLVELWRMYLDLLPGANPASPVAMPLYALRHEPFWHLIRRPDAPATKGRVRATIRFNRYFIGVTLDKELHLLLTQRATRLEFRRALIETYFPRERWIALETILHRDRSDELALSAYAQRLLAEATFGVLRESPATECDPRTLRDRSFRKAVTFAYDYRCTFCGVRLVGGDNRTVVEAAHIVPWAETHDDRPVNGLCLCPLCHWAFDARMLAINLNGKILTHSKIQAGSNLPGHLSTFKDRAIFPPREERFLPDSKCVEEQLKRFAAA